MKPQAKNKIVILGRAVNLFPEASQGEKTKEISAVIATMIATLMSPGVFGDNNRVMDTSSYQKKALNAYKESQQAYKEAQKIIAQNNEKLRILSAWCSGLEAALKQPGAENDEQYPGALQAVERKCN